VQARSTFGEQPLGERGRHVHPDLAHRGDVVGHGVDPLPHDRGDHRAGQLRHPLDAFRRGDGHDSGEDRHVRDVRADRGDPVAQPQVVPDPEEHLRDGEPGSRP